MATVGRFKRYEYERDIAYQILRVGNSLRFSSLLFSVALNEVLNECRIRSVISEVLLPNFV